MALVLLVGAARGRSTSGCDVATCARILFLARAEVLHVVRDRATLAQILVLPLVQLLVLSNAATFEIRNTPTYVVDFDRTSASRGLVDAVRARPATFDIVGQSASPDAGERGAAARRRDDGR